MKICSIEGCEKPVHARGWCNMHYLRWRYTRDPKPSVPSRRRPAQDRFWEKVRKTETCWLWIGLKIQDGYGVLKVDGKTTLAHRFSYEMRHGSSISAGLVIDHICGVRACVNPDHLRLATNKQNCENIAIRSDNTSGVRGVSWVRNAQRWRAHVTHHGTRYDLGYFDDLGAAETAVVAKRNELFTHNDRDREVPQQNEEAS